jgi:hypothetical protein
MDKIDEMCGLDLCYSAPINKKWASKEVIDAPTKQVSKAKKENFTPVKILRGFVH